MIIAGLSVAIVTAGLFLDHLAAEAKKGRISPYSVAAGTSPADDGQQPYRQDDIEDRERAARREHDELVSELNRVIRKSRAIIGAAQAAIDTRETMAIYTDRTADEIYSSAVGLMDSENASLRSAEEALRIESQRKADAVQSNPEKWGLSLQKIRNSNLSHAMAEGAASLRDAERQKLAQSARDAELRREEELRLAEVVRRHENERSHLRAGRDFADDRRQVSVAESQERLNFAIRADAYLAAGRLEASVLFIPKASNLESLEIAHAEISRRIGKSANLKFTSSDIERATSWDKEVLYCHAWGSLEFEGADGTTMHGDWSVIFHASHSVDPSSMQLYTPRHGVPDARWSRHGLVWNLRPKAR